MTRCVFILHTTENSIENLPFENLGPTPNPPKWDWPYKYLAGEYYHIPTIWWASDLEVVPQVGWYLDTPNKPAETTCWGLDVRVVRVKLRRDYHINPIPMSYVEIICRVAYEEG